jgi:hypothetical protein
MAGVQPLLTALVVAAFVTSGSSTSMAEAGPPGLEVQLRLTVRGGFDDGALHVVQTTTGALLASAGITASWRDCAAAACLPEPGATVVLVHLMPVRKLTDATVSGEMLRDGRSGLVTVVVYLPRVVEVTDAIRNLSESRSNPSLATLDVGHLVGLTVAHEVGHGLGLPHAGSGVMKARPSAREVMALRTSALAFRGSEVARMRLTLLAPPDGQLARGR